MLFVAEILFALTLGFFVGNYLKTVILWITVAILVLLNIYFWVKIEGLEEIYAYMFLIWSIAYYVGAIVGYQRAVHWADLKSFVSAVRRGPGD